MQKTGLAGGRGYLFYLESLLMTRMSAPFSSFSLWLSAFKSGSIWKGRKKERRGEGGKRRRERERERERERRRLRQVLTDTRCRQTSQASFLFFFKQMS